MEEKIAKSKKRKKSLLGLLKGFAVIALLCFVIIKFIMLQVSLSDQKDVIKSLNAQASASQHQNDEFSRLLDMTNEREYMERIAIERLGYAYPSEKRFYDTSRN